MKRALLLVFLILVCAVGFLYAWGLLPFVPALRPDIVAEVRSTGMSLIIITYAVIVMLALLLYMNEILDVFRGRYRESVAPIVEETHRASLALSHRFEGTEKAIEFFAGAIQQYAHHLESHTSAIRGLSEASQSLRDSAVEQNRILHRMAPAFDRAKPEEEVSGVEKVVTDLEKRTQLVLQVKEELECTKAVVPAPPLREAPPEKITPEEVKPEPLKVTPPEPELRPPPGCLGNPRATYSRLHSPGRS
jgi:signal transduction histidine kinase